MSKTLKTLLIVLAVLVLVGAGGLFYYSYYLNNNSQKEKETTKTNTTTNKNINTGKAVEIVPNSENSTTVTVPTSDGGKTTISVPKITPPPTK